MMRSGARKVLSFMKNRRGSGNSNGFGLQPISASHNPPAAITALCNDPAVWVSRETAEKIAALIEPFNKKGVEIADSSTFAGDLEFDSLTVMDFVAAIEDEFDIIISMNQQAEIETYGQLIDAVVKLQG